MKTISNIVKTIIASSFSLVLGFFVVVPAFAVGATDNSGTEVKTGAGVCTRISTLSTSGRNAVATKRTTLQTDFSNRLANISSKQTEVDAKVAAIRTAATAKFDDKIKSLEAETGLTDVQKTAIETFKTGVLSAETTRAAAVDDARSAYRTALATLIATQQQTLSTAVTTYQTAVSAAFSTAVANCTTDNAAATMIALKTAIKDARTTLNSARTPDVTKTAIKDLATTRQAAIKAANEEFVKTVAALSATLKTALGVTTTDSTPTTTP